jgi:hypothetical protein
MAGKLASKMSGSQDDRHNFPLTAFGASAIIAVPSLNVKASGTMPVLQFENITERFNHVVEDV